MCNEHEYLVADVVEDMIRQMYKLMKLLEEIYYVRRLFLDYDSIAR